MTLPREPEPPPIRVKDALARFDAALLAGIEARQQRPKEPVPATFRGVRFG